MATYQRPKKVKNQKEDPAELIVNKLDKSAGRFEQLIEKYKREIVWTIGGIIIVFLGYMAYHTWIAKPSQIEAAEELALQGVKACVVLQQEVDDLSLNLIAGWG